MKAAGANYLKVWTSDRPVYVIARQLYERRGFSLFQQVPKKRKQMNLNILYYQLKLQ